MTLREQILALDDLQRKPVVVDEWGMTVWVRMLRADERDAFEQAQADAREEDGKGLVGTRARLVAACACDEAGQRIFTDLDVPALGQKSAGAMQKIFNVAMKLNGFSGRDVEELAKN